MLRYGVVENRNDPFKLGRCQVRVIGLHTADKTILPTEELPWALMMQPATSAAMSGIGQAPVGVVPGTWVIVMFADGEECQQPVIMGTLGGIPDVNTITAAADDDIIVLKDPVTGQPSEQITTTDSQGNKAQSTSAPVTTPPQPPKMVGGGGVDKTLPPTSPPPNSVKNTGLAAQGINAIILACQEHGFTDRNAMSAILGVVGGECLWIPKTENLKYSAKRLLEVFPKTFRSNPALAKEIENNPEKIAEVIYGGNSKGLGNNEVGDGFKYIGRGFIQLTGKTNYTYYGKLANVDILNNPELLNSDLSVSAKVAIVYLKDRLKKSSIAQNDPRYFDAVAKSVNNDPGDIYQRKRRFYEYFLGKELPASSVDKSAGLEDVQKRESSVSKTGYAELPGGDRSSNSVLGFSDPNGKYPLRSYLHEPDTNRLARGQIAGTCVEKKDAVRLEGIPTAFGGSWDQPVPPFAAVYPYNKVFESESGHVMEFDDSPQSERINLYHRSGTFTEIDVYGSQVNRIVGDGYTIYDRNGCIYIAGEANVTVEGNINILCNSDANVEVMGNANVDVGIDATIGVGQHVNLGVGGNVNAKIVGNVGLEVGGNMSAKVTGNFDLKCKNFSIEADKASIKTTGITAIDASSVYWNSGKSNATLLINIGTIHIPAVGSSKGSNLKYLETPPRAIVDDFSLGETPDEFDAQTTATLDKGIVGEKSTPANTPADQKTETYANNIKGLPAKCDLILSQENFQGSFVLSPKYNLTIAKLTEINSSFPCDAMVSDSKDGQLYKITKQEVVCNMKQLTENIIDKVLDIAGKDEILITSSFRTAGVSVHSSVSSDHNKGRAVDMQLKGKPYDAQAHYDLITQLYQVLPYDQLILEYRDPKPGQVGKRKVWIHISYRGDQNRKMAFTMLNDKTYEVNGKRQPAGYFVL